MRRGLLLVLAVGLIPAASASGSKGTKPAFRTATFRMSATGEIRQLGTTRIAVGHVTCAIPAKTMASAFRFVIGDPVTINCLDGRLLGVKYAPEHAAAQTNGPVGSAAGAGVPAATSHPPSLDAESAFSLTFGTITLGGASFTSTTSKGTIDGLSSTSITVGTLTCTYPALFGKLPPVGLSLGDSASITCRTDTGVLTTMSVTHRRSA